MNQNFQILDIVLLDLFSKALRKIKTYPNVKPNIYKLKK
jgi:hypothetical protein